MLAACASTLACSGPAYYWQAASGQYELMRDRQDIEALLNDPETRPDLAGRLRTSREILDFARQHLDLPAEDSYTSYVETGREAVVWNVVAAPEFSLQAKKWCFAIAGCVPYRGYFEQEKAQRSAMRLQNRGFDVAISPATAYSTLGWFKDPLLDTMMQSTDTRLAATLIHEVAHQKLFVKGDTAFNEAYASFVENAGVAHWLDALGNQDEVSAWQQSRSALAQFHALLADTRQELQQLYRRNLTLIDLRAGKAAIFENLEGRYEQLKDEAWAGRDYFGGWFEGGVNNADLALFNDYQAGVCAFSQLFAQVGSDFGRFHKMVRNMASQDRETRKAWLEKDCPAIASSPDL